MRGALGEKIGEGVYADVHAWAPGRVLKLYKAGIPRKHSWWEARMIRAVFAAGAPAPEVFDEVTLEGRFGNVLTRFDGPTLLQLSRSGAITPEQTGAILAALAVSVHKIAAPPEVLSLRDRMGGALRRSHGLPDHIATGIGSLVERLAPGDGLCHGDVHPGNVVMTASGPRFVDWDGATRAPAVFDLASCHVTNAEVAPETVDDPERPRANNAAMQSEYARLTGMHAATLAAAMEPFLSVVRVIFLMGAVGNRPGLRERLIERIEATLRSHD